jgi:hypothetical protein
MIPKAAHDMTRKKLALMKEAIEENAMERISTMPGQPGVIWGIKEVCKVCRYWTQEAWDHRYRCYMGDCPAMQRDKEKTMEDPVAEAKAHTEWDKNNRPEDFIRYTLSQAYALMDEVYDVAKEHKIDLHDYLPAAIQGAFAVQEKINEDSKPD